MRKLSLSLAMLATTAITAPAFAEGTLPIVEEPMELTIHMHWPRAQGYGVGGDTSKIYPVEEAARAATNIHLIDQTFGKNSKESHEAMNLLIASGDMPDIVGGHLIQQPVNEFGPQGAFMPLNELVDEHAPNTPIGSHQGATPGHRNQNSPQSADSH